MAVKFFGQFLVEKGIVSREILLQAIEMQESVNLSFGMTALAMKLLTESDIERIHLAQRTDDLRFGDMAVKLEILSDEQMQQVLTRQKTSHLYIGEALVKVGGLTEGDLKKYLDEFKADQAAYATDRIVIPDGAPHGDLLEIMADLTHKMLTRVALLTFRPEPGRIVNVMEKRDVVASMGFNGDITGSYILAVSSPVQNQIAKAILTEDNVDDEPREVLDDTVMEFINIVCGNIAAKIAQRGKNMNIAPPEILDSANGVEVPRGMVGVVFPVCLSDGEHAELAIFIAP